MSLIVGEHVGQQFGEHRVFAEASFRLSEADRVGLVGPNGEGKTTLLRIMAGLLEPSTGRCHRSRGLRIGYLPQAPPELEGDTIYDAMLEVFADVRSLEQELHELASAMAGGETSILKRYGELQGRFEALGGHGYTTRIEQVLTGLGFERATWDRPLAKLSGGQRTRAHLATLLLREPQVLMLDEPTNHLDLDSVEWLEGWLRSFRGALVVVSHDRYFLDRVTESTWEVAFARVEIFHGAYSHYLTQREERHKERSRRWEAQQEYVAKTEEFIARHLAGQRSKEAQGRRTRLARFLRDEGVERPEDQQTINVALPEAARTGDLVLRVEDLAAGYQADRPLVRIERLEIERGWRVAIVGANGAGKTTLLRTLLGELPPLAGQIRWGSNVSLGYLSQTHCELDPSNTALEAVMAVDHRCPEERARSLLGRLLLGGDEALKRVDQLSGGQRTRVVLARLVLARANVLLLDEPTNHLDIASRDVIQEVLQQFGGTVFLVSHDRYLIQAAATHIWAIDGQGLHVIRGGWEEYLQWRGRGGAAAGDGTSDEAAAPAESKEDRRADYRESRRQANAQQRLKAQHEAIEAEVEAVEQTLAKLTEEISAAGQAADVERVERLGRDYERQDARLKELWAEWERIGEQLG